MRVAAPPACRAGAPPHQALGSKSSLCTYSRVLPRLWCITVAAATEGSRFYHSPALCYETLIRQALDAPIRFLLRCPSRRQNRRSHKRMFPTNMITCIRHCNPHVTHHVQSSRDSQLSRFTKCLSPSLSHPLSLYVRSFHTLHSRAAQLHSLHSCTVSVVNCALSTVRSNAQSTVVYVQHCTVIPQECTVNAQPPLMYINP